MPTETAAHVDPLRSMLAFLAVYAGIALLVPGSPAFLGAALVLAVVLGLVDSFAFIAMTTQRRPAQRYGAEDLGSARSDRRPRTRAARTQQTRWNAAWHENINRKW